MQDGGAGGAFQGASDTTNTTAGGLEQGDNRDGPATVEGTALATASEGTFSVRNGRMCVYTTCRITPRMTHALRLSCLHFVSPSLCLPTLVPLINYVPGQTPGQTDADSLHAGMPLRRLSG